MAWILTPKLERLNLYNKKAKKGRKGGRLIAPRFMCFRSLLSQQMSRDKLEIWAGVTCCQLALYFSPRAGVPNVNQGRTGRKQSQKLTLV